MASISSPGVGSGLDVRGLVSQLVAAEGQPATIRLNAAEKRYNAQLSALGTLKSGLSNFQTSLSDLTSLTAFNTRTATSGNTDLYTTSATGTAISSSYEIDVQQLAQAHKLASQAYTDSTSAVGTGDLIFQFGDPNKAAQTVAIGAGDDSLQGVRDAVNAADIGVTATIINGDAGYQLVFSSDDTGLDNSLKISVSENPADGTNTDMSGLSAFAYDPLAGAGAGQNLTQKSAAQDAVVLIDGIQVSSATNTVSDALDGVSIELKAADPGSKSTLAISTDTESVGTTIETFVDEYNKLMGTLNALGRYDPAKDEQAALVGDSTLRSVRGRMQGIISNTVSGLSGTYRMLAEIGISTQSDGTIALDKTKLDTALNDNFDEVGRIFAANGSPTDSLVQYVGSTTDTLAGTYAVDITQAASRGSYIDATSSISSLTVDGTNDAFTLTVDGVASGTITLNQGVYASADLLAAELQSKINGDSLLSSRGASVAVAYDGANNRFSFTSNRYGSNTGVDITSVGATGGLLGLTVNAGAVTAGTDVAGTIGGVAATGSGQFLTGAGDTLGLQLQILAQAPGARGDVVFSRGVADQMNNLFNDLLDTDNFLDSRTSSLNDQLKSLDTQRESLTRRLDRMESGLMRQFSALDGLMAGMQATSSFLSAQLSSLSNLN